MLGCFLFFLANINRLCYNEYGGNGIMRVEKHQSLDFFLKPSVFLFFLCIYLISDNMLIILIVIFVLLIIDPNISKTAIMESASLWLYSLIPVLFPSLVITEMMANERLLDKLCYALYKPFRFLFNIMFSVRITPYLDAYLMYLQVEVSEVSSYSASLISLLQ